MAVGRALQTLSLASLVAGSSKWPVHSRHTAPRHAYIHVPFCRRRCFYCNFAIVPIGSKPQAATAAVDAYLAPLLREIRTAAREERVPAALETVYIGGGTPSLAPPRAIAAILDCIREEIGIDSGAEVTLEADPGTFDDEKLNGFLAAGVTRISLGLQSFDAERLAVAGRAHSVADGASATALMRRARRCNGLQSWSVRAPRPSAHVPGHALRAMALPVVPGMTRLLALGIAARPDIRVARRDRACLGRHS